MKIKIQNETGSAILIALCLMMMLSLVAIIAVNSSNTDVELSINQLHADKAFYLAEAGAKRAFNELQSDPVWTAGYSAVPFEGGTYSVQIIDSSTNAALDDTILIIATGWTMNAQVDVEMTVAPDITNPFEYAMFAKDAIDIRNSMMTDSYNSDSGSYLGTRLDSSGDVGSNGTIDVANGAFVGGDITTSLSGGTDVNAGATVTGTVADDAPPQEIPDVPQAEFDTAAITNDNLTGLSGTYTYDSVTHTLSSTGTIYMQSGTYYFSDITLMNTATIILAPGAEVTLYVTGDIEMKNSSSVNVGGSPSDFLIYSQGDLVLKNSGDFYGSFYSPDGDCDLRNSGEFFGSIIANTIISHNSSNFHYDRNLATIKRKWSDDMLMIAWREL